MEDNYVSLLAELRACRQLVEEYANRYEKAVEEHNRTGKIVFYNLSRDEEEYITQRCKSILSKLLPLIPDAIAQWQNIDCPIDIHRDSIEVGHGFWVRRCALLRLLENTVQAMLDSRPIPTGTTPSGAETSDLVTVQFLAANPMDTDPLDLTKEVEAIRTELWDSEHRNSFVLKEKFESKIDDISKQLLRNKPHIVHFSGHGSKAGEIILQDERGHPCSINGEVITKLFSILKGNIRCVVLNACFTETQAALISECIDCVVGMSKELGDEAAIRFAQGFYRGVGGELDLEAAFELARTQINAHDLDESKTPKIKWKGNVPQKIFLVGPRSHK